MKQIEGYNKLLINFIYSLKKYKICTFFYYLFVLLFKSCTANFIIKIVINKMIDSEQRDFNVKQNFKLVVILFQMFEIKRKKNSFLSL